MEFFVLMWVIIEWFRDYLYYVLYFIVFSDNNLFSYIFIILKLDVIRLWWVGELFDF